MLIDTICQPLMQRKLCSVALFSLIVPGSRPNYSLGSYDRRGGQNTPHGGGRVSAPKSAWRARRTRRRGDRRRVGVARRGTGAMSRGQIINDRGTGRTLSMMRMTTRRGIGRRARGEAVVIITWRSGGGGTRCGGRGSTGRGHNYGRSACRKRRGGGCGHDSVLEIRGFNLSTHTQTHTRTHSRACN